MSWILSGFVLLLLMHTSLAAAVSPLSTQHLTDRSDPPADAASLSALDALLGELSDARVCFERVEQVSIRFALVFPLFVPVSVLQKAFVFVFVFFLEFKIVSLQFS